MLRIQKTLRPLITAIASLSLGLGLVSCSTSSSPGLSHYQKDNRNKMIISVEDQEMMLVTDGIQVKTYRISTSKFGIGDTPGSNCTPLGHMEVARKIGDRAPLGAVFKSRRRTGEILKPNAPGRDPIVTRILWLKGNESRNRNTFHRMIYIHGTPEERNLGKPSSYGCIRMASNDIADLYRRVDLGADVFVVPESIRPKPSEQTARFLNDFKRHRGG